MNKRSSKVPGRRAKHSLKLWLKEGDINPSIRGYKKLKSFLKDLERQLVEESGGTDRLTAAREILIHSTIRAYGVVLLTEMYIAKHSIFRPDLAEKGVLQYQPILERNYWSAHTHIRQNLLALGLDKLPEPPISVTDYIKAYDAKKEGKEGKDE